MSEDIKQYGDIPSHNMKGALYNIGDVVRYLPDGKNWDRWPPMTVTGVNELDVDKFWYTVNSLPFWVPENQLKKRR